MPSGTPNQPTDQHKQSDTQTHKNTQAHTDFFTFSNAKTSRNRKRHLRTCKATKRLNLFHTYTETDRQKEQTALLENYNH